MQSKDRQKELIRELNELGQLLERKTKKPQDEAATSSRTQPDTDKFETTSESATSVFDPAEDVNSPETVDMFSAESLVDDPASSSNSEPENNELLNDALTDTESLPPMYRDSEYPPSPMSPITVSTTPSDGGMSRESITELSREIIDTVEKTISHRSGEPLDEALREKLLSEVFQQLSAWLESDTS